LTKAKHLCKCYIVPGTDEKELGQSPGEAVLGMTVRRLTGLKAGKLQEEQQQLAATIADLQVCGVTSLPVCTRSASTLPYGSDVGVQATHGYERAT
jgi:hypothetical protein